MNATRAARERVSRSILVVEDNLAQLEVLGMLLVYERLRCAPASDGQQALAWLAVHRPALVILDWLLPTGSGAEVLAAVRERYGRTVPVLVLSVVADSEEARRAGADAYLRKPYAVEDLVAVVQRLLVDVGLDLGR